MLRPVLLCASLAAVLAAAMPSLASAAPTVRYAYAPTSPTVRQTVTFDGTATRCDAYPCSYSWSDDGPDGPGGRNYSLGAGRTLKFAFSGAGRKYVRLTVRNRRGASASTMKTVTVAAAPAPAPRPEPQPQPQPEPRPEPQPQPEPESPPAGCTSVSTTAGALQSAFAAASGGEVLCLADGAYGDIFLGGTKARTVTVRAQNPGKATTGRITLIGSNIRVERFVASGVRIAQPSHHIAIVHNRLTGTGGGFGVELAPDHTPMTPNVTIEGNQIIGPFTDALRVNGYTGTDAPGHPGWGLAVVDNEITGIIEDGSHNDCIQSVWGGSNLLFEGNYLHDNRCQGFFIKDSVQLAGIYPTNIKYADNLQVRNNAGPGVSGNFNVYETRGFRGTRNTFWATGSFSRFNSCDQGAVEMDHNVIDHWQGAAAGGCRAKFDFHDNTYGSMLSWSPGPGDTVGRPAFADPATDDYRILGSDRGVTWRPADRRYGP